MNYKNQLIHFSKKYIKIFKILISKKYNLKISVQKPRQWLPAFQGKYCFKTKIMLDDAPIEQITSFEYLTCEIKYNYEIIMDSKTKLPLSQQVCGIINRFMKNRKQKEFQITFDDVLAVTFFYVVQRVELQMTRNGI